MTSMTHERTRFLRENANVNVEVSYTRYFMSAGKASVLGRRQDRVRLDGMGKFEHTDGID